MVGGPGRAETGRGGSMARAEVSRENPEGGPQTAGVRFCAKSDSEYNCATSARGNWAVDAKGALKLDAPSSGQSLTCLPPPLPLNACSPLPISASPGPSFSHSLLCISPCWGMRPPITTSFCTHRPPHSPSFRASPRFARHPIFMHPHLSRLRASLTFPAVDAKSPFSSGHVCMRPSTASAPQHVLRLLMLTR